MKGVRSKSEHAPRRTGTPFWGIHVTSRRLYALLWISYWWVIPTPNSRLRKRRLFPYTYASSYARLSLCKMERYRFINSQG